MNIIIETIIETLFLIFTISLPFIIILFPLLVIYVLIKGLMKYHHDLKSGNQDSQVLSDNGEQV